MKKFDPTKPFTCRDPSYTAEILCTDLTGPRSIVCKITMPDGSKVARSFFEHGGHADGCKDPLDLINVPEKKTAWVVINELGKGYVTTALQDLDLYFTNTTVIPIEYTVGEKRL